MIAAPYVERRDKDGERILIAAVHPRPVFGLSDWNRKLMARGKASA